MKLPTLQIAAFLAAALAVVSCCLPEKETTFRTDALDDSAWLCSEWISAADAPVVNDTVRDGCRAADGASWFVSTIRNEAKVASAKWMTTSLGVFEIYVNGKPVGSEILRPGFTHPYKTKRSFTYDVTGICNLKAGDENRFSAQVTPGWWGDKIVTPRLHLGMTGKKCAFRGVLELVFTDGSRKLYGTDTDNWLAGIAGPVKHAAIFDGEEYDARVLPGYDTPEMLSKPEVNTEFSGEILPSDGAEIYLRRDLAFSPVSAYVWKDVEGMDDDNFGKVKIDREYAPGKTIDLKAGETLVVDFGQNLSGVPEFVFKAAEGTTLRCLPAELLNDGNGSKSRGMDGPEGSVHRQNLRIPETGMILDYTFGPSDKYVTYHPHCTFFGYRFVSVTVSGETSIRNITSLPVTSIAADMQTGTLKTGNELVNRLIENTVWGQMSNYLSVPTDCPQRNERLGWSADTQVFTETGSFFANTSSFFHKWTRDMRDTQAESGGFPGVAPWAQYGCEPTAMMRVGWSDAGIIVPWTIWKQFADTQIVEENWGSMVRFITHLDETRYDHKENVAENGNYQWADWLSFEPLESSSGKYFTRGTDGNRIILPDALEYWNYLLASYWAIDASMMRDMAAATGRNASVFEDMTSRAKSYLKDRFLNDDGTFRVEILNTMQTPALFALKNGIVEGEARDAMISRLRKNFAEHDGCLQTGFLGTSVLLPTLTDNGCEDVAMDLLMQRKNPSWLYSVDNGATTIWERWNSYTMENGMGPKGMNSFNHYAYGCVCQWIWESVAGIRTDISQPGFKHIIMRPIPDRRLGFVDAEYDSAAGKIKSSWKYEGDVWNWTFTIPEGSTATVTLPGSSESSEYGSGTYSVALTSLP